MTHKEIYDNKRQNFIEKTYSHFAYLTSEYGYDKPIHKKYQQDNGVITRDDIVYNNAKLNRRISISNAYHPVDYGFEICFYDPTISTEHPDREMVHYVLKENQDTEQSYLENAAALLKEKFEKQIKGEVWFPSDTNEDIETTKPSFFERLIDRFLTTKVESQVD